MHVSSAPETASAPAPKRDGTHDAHIADKTGQAILGDTDSNADSPNPAPVILQDPRSLKKRGWSSVHCKTAIANVQSLLQVAFA